MIKFKDIQILFSDFCEDWHYCIEDFREDIGVLTLKHKKYSSYKDSYIFIDFYDGVVQVYSKRENKPNLFSDVLEFDEIHDLYSAIFKVTRLK